MRRYTLLNCKSFPFETIRYTIRRYSVVNICVAEYNKYVRFILKEIGTIIVNLIHSAILFLRYHIVITNYI